MNQQLMVIIVLVLLLGGGWGYSTYWRSPGPTPADGAPGPGWYGGNQLGGIVGLLLTLVLIVYLLRALGIS